LAELSLVNGLPLYACDPDDFAGIDQLDVIDVPHPDA
jgi:tRNA(fMet)-specific endonuclease VapC